jgi:hypothetical protein
LQFHGEWSLGYTFAVAKWNVFGGRSKKSGLMQPAGGPRKVFKKKSGG